MIVRWYYIAAFVVGFFAGLAGVYAALASRNRLDLLRYYWGHANTASVLTVALAGWYGWYSLLGVIPAGLLVFAVSSLDIRKKF